MHDALGRAGCCPRRRARSPGAAPTSASSSSTTTARWPTPPPPQACCATTSTLAGLPRPDGVVTRRHLRELDRWTPPWWETVAAAEQAVWPEIPDGGAACVVRGNATEREVPFLSRLVDSLAAVPGTEAQTDYLALLDRALMDRVLSVREQQALVATAVDLGIDQPTAIGLHRAYLHSLARTAAADGIVTDGEREDLHAVAALLDLDPAEVDDALVRPRRHGRRSTSPRRLRRRRRWWSTSASPPATRWSSPARWPSRGRCGSPAPPRPAWSRTRT